MTPIKLLIIAILLTGCSSTTLITDRAGKTFQVESQKDAVVTFKDNDVTVTVDNRGKPSTFDELIKLYFMRWQAEEAKEAK
jgi:hypothetical protein